MSWSVRISARAEEDIREILDWTREHFGEYQAETYAETLSLALESLFEGPHVLGVKERLELGAGIFSLHVAKKGRKGRHIVLFRAAAPSRIDVLRVLHESMDITRHIS